MLPTKNAAASPGRIESSRRKLSAIFSNLSLFSSPSKLTYGTKGDDEGSLTAASVSLSDLEGSVTHVNLGSRLLDLPDELITHILGFLPPDHAALHAVGLVNHRLRYIAESPQLWSSLVGVSPGIELDWEELKRRGTSREPFGEWDAEGGWIPTNDETNPIHYPTLYRSRRLLERIVRGRSPKVDTLLTVIPHADSVYCLAIAEPWLVTGGRDKSLQILRMSIRESRLVANVENAHEGSVLACTVELDRDGGIIVTGSSDMTAVVWRVKRREGEDTKESDDLTELEVEKEHTLRGHVDSVLDVALAPNHIITCSKDTTIRIYSRDYILLHHLDNAHTGPVNCLSLNPDNASCFVSASGDGSWIMFDLSTAEELCKVVTSGHALACIAWKGSYIVTGSNDRDVRIYNSSGTLLRRLQGHAGTVRALDLDVDEQGKGVVVSGSYDHTVTMWNVETGRIRQRFPNVHEGMVLDVQLKHGRLFSASDDRTVRVTTFGADLPYRELLV